jgi:hypothetical protein
VVVQKDGDRLTVRLVLEVDEYPEGGSMGRLMRSAGSDGVSGEGDGKRDELLEQLCKEAMSDFNRLAAQLQ